MKNPLFSSEVGGEGRQAGGMWKERRKDREREERKSAKKIQGYSF